MGHVVQHKLWHYTLIIAYPTILEAYQLIGGWFVNYLRDIIAALIVTLLIRCAIITSVCFYRLHWIIWRETFSLPIPYHPRVP